MNAADWAAQQVRALLDAWREREAAIARGMAQHNYEIDMLASDPAKRAELLRRLTGPPPETPPTD